MTRLDRRNFLAALAASVVAAGSPLPVGYPTAEATPNQRDIAFFGTLFVSRAGANIRVGWHTDGKGNNWDWRPE